jgi:hypothetical protein
MKVSSSVGMMTFPYIMENKIHVPNHQARYFCVLGFPPSEDEFF